MCYIHIPKCSGNIRLMQSELILNNMKLIKGEGSSQARRWAGMGSSEDTSLLCSGLQVRTAFAGPSGVPSGTWKTCSLGTPETTDHAALEQKDFLVQALEKRLSWGVWDVKTSVIIHKNIDINYTVNKEAFEWHWHFILKRFSLKRKALMNLL